MENAASRKDRFIIAKRIILTLSIALCIIKVLFDFFEVIMFPVFSHFDYCCTNIRMSNCGQYGLPNTVFHECYEEDGFIIYRCSMTMYNAGREDVAVTAHLFLFHEFLGGTTSTILAPCVDASGNRCVFTVPGGEAVTTAVTFKAAMGSSADGTLKYTRDINPIILLPVSREYSS